MRKVAITREPVELYKILKFQGIASSGGEAKLLVDSGQVLVNDQIETRRRRKIVSGDVIKTPGAEFELLLNSEIAS